MKMSLRDLKSSNSVVFALLVFVALTSQIKVTTAQTLFDPRAQPSKLNSSNETIIAPVARTKDNNDRGTKHNKLPIEASLIPNKGKPGMVMFNLKSTNDAGVEFKIYCESFSAVYQLTVLSSDPKISYTMGENSRNISCTKAIRSGLPRVTMLPQNGPTTHQSDANEDAERKYVGVARGQFYVKMKGKSIGRSFFIITARQLSSTAAEDFNSKLDNSAVDTSEDGSLVGVTYQTSRNKSNIMKNTNMDAANQDSDKEKQKPSEEKKRILHPDQVGMGMILVMQMPRLVDAIFRNVLMVVIVVATTGMGLKVDVEVVKKVLRKPVGPALGLICQFFFMPLIAYTVATSIPQESAAISLGIFTCGVVPGGGPSNMFTYLLDGDLSLSVTMTALSNIAALVMTPLWIFTLGSTFKDDKAALEVPFAEILKKLCFFILPIFCGIFIQIKFPKIRNVVVKILKPVILCLVTGLISLGIYTNSYIFAMINPNAILAGCMLPYLGYLVGGMTSLFCCQTWKRVRTIAIETGIQNTAIAYLILFLSLPPPDNQLAAVGPAASSIMTPLPLFIAVIIYTIYKKCNKIEDAEDGEDDDNNKEADEESGESRTGNGSGDGVTKNGLEDKDREVAEGLLNSKKGELSKKELQDSRKNWLIDFLTGGGGKPLLLVIKEKITGKKSTNIARETLGRELSVSPPTSPSSPGTDDKKGLWDANANVKETKNRVL